MPLSRLLPRLATTAIVGLLLVGTVGCEKGEKSCRYYSMVLDAKGATLRKRNQQLETIRALPIKEMSKCDDDGVFGRIGKAMDTKELRPTIVAVLESLGHGGKSLRNRSEKLLIKALATEDTAGQAAQVIRAWRIESAESGRDPWFPSKEAIKSLADWTRKYKKETKSALVEALFVSLATPEDRAEYEDLLIELAGTDPGEQGVETNLKAISYLTEIYRHTPGTPVKAWDQGTGAAAFDVFVKSLYTRDAVRAETFMAGRLALGTVDKGLLAKKMLAIYNMRDPDFEKWAKEYGLSDWEWKEGPKAIQVLADLHDPSTAADLIAAVNKPIDGATPMGDFTQKNKNLPWPSYITSRFQLTMWAFAAMGEGLAPYADQIGEVAKNPNLAVEQRTLPFIGLSFSGASTAWASMLKAFGELPDGEKPDFLTPLTYAVEPQNLDDWNRVIATSKAEGVMMGVADAVVKARLNVVTECKKGVDAAVDEAGKTTALLNCYKGFLTTGDDIAKEKAAIGLIHLGVRTKADVLPLLAEAMNKAPATSTTLRQVIVAGFRSLAQPKDSKLVYDLKEAQVSVPNAQTWIWDLEVLTSQLLQQSGAVPVGNIPAAGSQVKPSDQKPEAPAAPAK